MVGFSADTLARSSGVSIQIGVHAGATTRAFTYTVPFADADVAHSPVRDRHTCTRPRHHGVLARAALTW